MRPFFMLIVQIVSIYPSLNKLHGVELPPTHRTIAPTPSWWIIRKEGTV